MISRNEDALDLIVKAINKSGFINGRDVSICLDVAANELFKKNLYSIHSKKFENIELVCLFSNNYFSPREKY